MPIELDNREFQNVWRLVAESSSSVFMTGRAGTGKSTFLRYIVENVKKKTVVLAPTGIAAVNAGGVTLHSFFKIPLQPFALDDVNYASPRRLRDMQRFNSEKIKLLQEVELIVIDEVSMVRADVLDFIDRVLRTYVRVHRTEPFGGKQMLLVGDAFQLEPVVKRDDWDILRRFYTTPYFFGAQVFKGMRLVQVELQKVYRQREVDFLSLLDRVRVGQMAPADLERVNMRVAPAFEPPEGEMYMTLTSTRAACDIINDRRLAELDAPVVEVEGVVAGDFPDASLPTNKLLTLKVGAQVVFVRNDIERRWYNGTVGSVVRFEDDGVWVRVEREEAEEREAGEEDEPPAGHETYFVERETWENVKYRYDENEHKVVSELLGTFTQLPLKLAWAITIHKSQGLTFDRAIIDLGRGAFACGQVYVALSRCRTLAGIVLRQPVSPADIKTNASVRDFSYGANDEALISRKLDDAKADSLAVAASEAFARHDYRGAVGALFDALALNPGALSSPVVRRYVARRLAVVDRLEAQIDNLVDNQRRIREKCFEFAYEYFLMAGECLHKYDDARAAKANVNKAIALAPDYADALVLRAGLNVDCGDFEAAAADLDVALKPGRIKKREKLAEALVLRARASLGLRRWERALADMRAALPLRGDEETLRLMAEVCRRNGLDDEAEQFRHMADDMNNDDDDDD